MTISKPVQKELDRILRAAGVDLFVRTLSKKFPRGHVYLVGGMVRDLLLGRETKDVDLVLAGVPAKQLQQFLKTKGSVNLVGKTFGVFKFVPHGSRGQSIDIALPRTEHAFGTGGYRDVKVKTNWKLPIEDDLSRRDFTMNALAYDLQNKKLVDPFDGLRDLKKKTIRAVRNPKERFKEDYSRMLRGLRFACQLGFRIEPKTWGALTTLMPRINARRAGERVVPYEVIAKELLKAFTNDPPRALRLFDRAGAIKALIPELLKMKKCPQPKNYHSEGDVWQHTALALQVLTSSRFKKEFGETPNAEVVFATLFHDIAKPLTIIYPQKRSDHLRFYGHDEKGAVVTRAVAERLKLSSYKDGSIDVDAERLFHLVRYHLLLMSGDPKNMRATTIERHYLRNDLLGSELLMVQFADGSAALDPHGRPGLGPYRTMKKHIQGLLNTKTKTLPPPLLNGNEIMRHRMIPPGPEVGKIIERLREAQLTGLVRTKAAALKFVERIAL